MPRSHRHIALRHQDHRPRRVTLAILVVILALGGALTGARPAAAYPGAPWFEPGKPYAQNFPDPSVLRVGDTYYAYATTTGGAYLPVMTSTDLRVWRARPAYNPGPPLDRDPYFNDALPSPARWAPAAPGEGRLRQGVWAPGVARIGDRFVAFYAVRVAFGDPGRACISVATAGSPLGPFRDDSAGPLVCDDDPAGSIDPAPFVDDDGTPYLLWKSEGVPGSQPTKIFVRRLDAAGTAFAPGSAPAEILRTSLPWEGNVVENPSLVRYGGRLYLFYSANEWRSAAYAIGYAECAAVTGPCARRGPEPLLASRGDRLGPGGPSAFVDGAGRLQLAFHYWNAPYTDYPAYPACQGAGTCATQGQRRLAVEPLRVTSAGLAVGDAPAPAGTCFPQTGRCVGGAFLAHWQAHGGLERNGYPLSDEFRERLEDGREYTVQYFERVRLEYHPENAAPYDVLLGQFGWRMLGGR